MRSFDTHNAYILGFWKFRIQKTSSESEFSTSQNIGVMGVKTYKFRSENKDTYENTFEIQFFCKI